jgi:release factor glutamine methyltransferase
MTVEEWMTQATKKLQNAGILSARLDSLILLEDTTKLSQASLLAHPEKQLTNHESNLLKPKLEKRINHRPLAYIRGSLEFYGHNFIVNPDVLIPRPESEAFLELLSELKPKNNQKLIDIGTGCGALAISTKLKFPNLEVSASDISSKALIVAKQNAKNLKASINFFNCDLLANNMNMYGFILANLPYVPKLFCVSPEVYAEPKIAIFADNEGLEYIENLATQSFESLAPKGYLLLESLPEQQKKIKELYTKTGFKFVKRDGLVLVFVRA